MPFTPTLINDWPTYDADNDDWGFILNDRGGETYTDMQAIATVLNAAEVKADGALQRSGGTMTGPTVLPQAAPTNALESGYRGAPIRTVSSSGDLLAADAGGTVRVTGATAVTITIPPNLYLVSNFTVFRNASTQPLTVARGSGVQQRIAGSATDKNVVVAPQGVYTIFHEAQNVYFGQGSGVA